jgi:hypothetical protein
MHYLKISLLLLFLLGLNDKAIFAQEQGWEWAIPPEFGDARDFHKGLAAVKQNEKYGFIDKTGKVVISPQFDDLGSFTKGLAAVEQNGKGGYIDKKGKIVISPQFDYLDSFTKGLAMFEQNGKWGYIDKKGKVVISPQFDAVGEYIVESYGFIRIKKNQLSTKQLKRLPSISLFRNSW